MDNYNAYDGIRKGEREIKRYALNFMKYAGKLAILTVFLSANTACNWFAYQGEVPKELNQFKRVK